MQPFPIISAQERQLLEIIVSNITIDGSTLMKQMGVSSPDDLITPIRELQKQQLIQVGGNLTTDGLPFARFGIRPSAKSYLSSLLQNMA